MSQARCQGTCGAVWRWEEAGESILNALTSYRRSCVFLEDSVDSGGANPNAIVSHIESSLETLHIKLANELVQSRLTLVRMRNRISSRFYSLPEKILAQIFMEVVYVPAPREVCRSMVPDLHRIYSRLHSLLGVCTTWRNVGISHRPLWAIIPVYDNWNGISKHLAPSLCLSRSTASPDNNTGIHLAALVSRGSAFQIPLLDHNWPKFDTVNVMSKSAAAIGRFLDDLAWRWGPSPSTQRLSELSIYQYRDEQRLIDGPKPYPDMFYDCIAPATSIMVRTRNSLYSLIPPLSTLRVRGADMQWSAIGFSNKLVELRLQSVNFNSDSKLLDFLRALNTARELRDLKIISIIAFAGSSSSMSSATRSIKCPLSKLQTLLLQDLDFNALRILQESFAPGPYRTTLCLTEEITQINVPRQEPNIVDLKTLCKVLKRISVDKLIIDREGVGPVWLDHTGLHMVLQSLPTVKTLMMSGWNFRKEDVLALERPRPKSTASKGSTVRFPNLTALYLDDARMVDAEGLKKVVTSRKIRTMSLSGNIMPPHLGSSDSDTDVDPDNADHFKDSYHWPFFNSNVEIVKWLQAEVAQFHLDTPESEFVDYDTSEWELW